MSTAPTSTTATSAPASADLHARTLATLARLLGDGVFATSEFRDNLRLLVPPARLLDLLRALKNECGFALLAELGATDYLGYPEWTRPRFEVHYVLLNLDTTERIVVKTGVDEPDPTVPSAVPLWEGANWMEREVFDMFGVRFTGHPDLRRILMPDEFAAFPLRKDYPLRGRGERHNFPKLTREQS
ncbi:MAG TPA: NADH-quinone oxidoreductase subunit C [Isosphaeraceae bacterium]|jgi:NADH-quinone oxidoreductase subunit C|nr:NADH-quinone oxidoreductase subunit C [Isosphaeraceae bacterium]